jgi:RNA polymerase sigma-70 factor (ECF subfamily)
MGTTGREAVRPPGASTQEADGGEPPGRFDEFARREGRALFAFAWSLTGDAAAAEDLAQEALAAAWRSWDRIGGYDKPGAWARRVVANQAVSRVRRSGREQRALVRLAARTADSVELEPADDRFWAEVRRLPERQAQAVALHYLEDRTVAEIATILGCAEGTVKVHLHRGRLALARALGLIGEEDDQ